MKRIFSTILVAALALGSVTAYAQTENKCAEGKDCKKEQCDKKGDKKCDKKCDKKDHHKKCKGERKEFNAFEGLQLTEQQQAALKAIPCPIKDKKECKGDKKECNDANKAKAHKEAKENYLNQVKNILTPEQYQQFLENNFKAKGEKPGKHHKKDGRHDKCDKQGKQCAKEANCEKK